MAAPKNLSAGQIINQLRRAPVGRLDRVAYLVCQRSLRHLAWIIRLLGRPVAKARPEAVRHGRDPQRAEQSGHRGDAERLSAHARKYELAAATERTRLLENLQRTTTERDPVLAITLRARGRDSPHSLVPVDLRLNRPTDLAGVRRRQHQELEGQLHGRP